ncbi:MAG: hypothetical protein IPK53_05125 [bacterium]|nr:hypothetical protein [bacterium]MBK8128339.1 hypothetical protein [bacterium]
MKKFRFSLERVQRVRKIQEAMRLAELKRAERALAAQQQKLSLFANERDAQSQAMSASKLNEFRILDCQTDWRYLQRIERIVRFQSDVVTEYTQHEDAARQRFRVARQRSLGLEKLGDHQRLAWNKDLIDLEQKIADDQPRKHSRHPQ